VAEEACAIVDQIRFSEAQTLWTREYEDDLVEKAHPGTDVYPGMMFSLAKGRMERSKLWNIVRKMPKGALLHCHFEAMIEAEWILERAFEVGNIGVRCGKSLERGEVRVDHGVPFEFGVIAEGTAKDLPSIWSSEYQVDSLVPLETAADSFPNGGRSGFLSWVRSRCSITPEESISHHHGINSIWVKFLSSFGIVRTLIYREGIFPQYVRRLCQQLHADNVLWADVRGIVPPPEVSANDPKAEYSEEETEAHYVKQMGIFQDAVDEYKASPEGQGFWGLRFIWTTVRAFNKRDIITGTSAKSANS
jgi:adenosine deaminase CECR1